MSYNNPQQVYFDADGCWGTADEGYFVVLDTTRWVQEDWDVIDSCRDGERMALAVDISRKYEVAQ
jgi:hypothetical protein